MSRVGIIDYDAGNLTSVETALMHLKADFIVSSDPLELKKTDKLIFPGVGEAGAAMKSLRKNGLSDFLREYKKSKKNILGICLGAQIVLTGSDEADTRCLDIVPGRALHFSCSEGCKIPHMGWNSISLEEYGKKSPLYEGIPDGTSFYFVHSYYPEPEGAAKRLTMTEYGISFCSSFQFENLFAVQFHPEKSGKWGLRLLENFIRSIGPDCVKAGS